MFLEKAYLISTIFVAACFSAPHRTPMWHLPCGATISEDASSWEDLEEETALSLVTLKLLNRIAMDDYTSRDYNYLYKRVDLSLGKEQYVPNWLPDEKDVDIVRKLTNTNSQMIVSHLPKLHMDLQKFAVAFEELIEDEIENDKKEALKGTLLCLRKILCEVEMNIVSSPSLRIPKRVTRSIMSNVERDIADDTDRLIRDWGVILKYHDYLNAWWHVFNY